MSVVPVKVTQTYGRSVLRAKKNSPHFFFAAGLVGVVTSAVLACRATLKLEHAVDEIKDDLVGIKDRKEGLSGSNYQDSDYYRDLAYVYGKSVVKVGSLYGPSVIIGGLSVAALTGSHIQLTRRNTALTVTLAAISKAFEEYRERVREEVGEERELEIHRAIRSEHIEGQKALVKITDPDGWSPYARSFDSRNLNWQNSSELNRFFIQAQQNYANQILMARGHLFLNEVYDMLGLERSTPGCVVGWVYEPKEDEGDGYVDFGMFEAFNNLNMNDQNFILDFNVDGVIFEKI